MSTSVLLEETLRSAEPVWESRGAVRALLARGMDRQTLEHDLTDFMVELRAAGRTQDEDVIYEVLEYLTGWCSPDMKL